MSYNQAFWASLILYSASAVFYLLGAMAFVKYLLKKG